MSEITIKSFVETNGNVPFQEWLDSLDRHTQARIAVGLTRLSRGNRSQVRGVGDGVAELKMDFGPGYRIYFGQGRRNAHHLARRRYQTTAERRHCQGQDALARIQAAEGVPSSMRLPYGSNAQFQGAYQSEDPVRPGIPASAVSRSCADLD
jgi:putative addiction module killer protein